MSEEMFGAPIDAGSFFNAKIGANYYPRPSEPECLWR